MASELGNMPGRAAPPIPSRRAPVTPSAKVETGIPPVGQGPPLHPAKRPLPPLPPGAPSADDKEVKLNPVQVSNSGSAITKTVTTTTTTKTTTVNRAKRGRPVITVLEARPMNEVGFRGVSPTNTSAPEITEMSAKPTSGAGLQDDTNQAELENKPKPSGVEMREKGRSAPPARPTSMPARPPRPPSQPSIKRLLPKTQEEVPSENLIDFSPPKENLPPGETQGGTKPAPPRPVSRPQSLIFSSSPPPDRTSSDSSGYVSNVTTCESQPSLSSDGTEEQAQPTAPRRRQFGIQVLPIGPGMLKPVSNVQSPPQTSPTSTQDSKTADDQGSVVPVASPRGSRKSVVPPSPRPRGSKIMTSNVENQGQEAGKEKEESTQNEEPRPPRGIMVLPPPVQQRSPSPRPRNKPPEQEKSEKSPEEKPVQSAQPPGVKPKPSVKPKPAVKPKPSVAPKPKVAKKPTVPTAPVKPSREVPSKPVHKYFPIMAKPAENDSFYEDKPLDDSFYETIEPAGGKNVSKTEEVSKKSPEDGDAELYPDLSSLGDDGTVYPDLSRVVANTDSSENKNAEGSDEKVPSDAEPLKPEFLEEVFKPMQKKRPTIIKALKPPPVSNKDQVHDEKDPPPIEPQPTSVNVENQSTVESESAAENETPAEEQVTALPRKPTIIRPSRRAAATTPEGTNERGSHPPAVHPKPQKSPPSKPASSPTASPGENRPETSPKREIPITSEDFNRVESYLTRSDSVSSKEEAENIMNEMRAKHSNRIRSVSTGSSESDPAHSQGAGRDLNSPEDQAKGGSSSHLETVPTENKRASQRSSWVPPGAVRVMGMPPPLPRSGPVALSTPDLRMDPNEREEMEETEARPVCVLPTGLSRNFGNRSVSMMTLQQPTPERTEQIEASGQEQGHGEEVVEEKKVKPHRPPPARPAPARPPPAKPAPTRPSAVPRKAPSDSTTDNTQPGKPPPSRPARPGSIRGPPKPVPPTSRGKKPPGPPPRLPSRPGPGHPLYHYVVQGPHGIALYDYTAAAQDELTFKAGDVIVLEEEISDGWMFGRNVDKKGIFPTNFIDVIEAPPVSDRKRQLSVGSAESAVPAGVGPRCIARFDYEPAEEGDLSFVAGDVIILIEHVGEDWLKGSVNGKEGIFPMAFAEIVEDLPAVSPTSPIQAGDGNVVTAAFDFQGETGDLAFKRSDKIQVLSQINSEWLYGQSLDGSTGTFPVAFVNSMPPEALPLLTKAPYDLTLHENQQVRANNACHLEKGEEEKKEEEEEEPHCLAEFDFTSGDGDDLHFVKGDKIRIVSHVNDDWMQGTLNGKTGMFPKAFVSIVKDIQEPRLTDKSTTPEASVTSPVEGENPTAPNIKGTKFGKAIALYDFVSESEEDLPLKVGDEVILKSKIGDDWYQGSLLNSDRTGMFPAAYVEVQEPLTE